jgi:hypothetical protein
MKLVIVETYPGEISCGCPEHVSGKLEKAITCAREVVKASLPDLPQDGQVNALMELSDLMSQQWSKHAKGLAKVILSEVRGE